MMRNLSSLEQIRRRQKVTTKAQVLPLKPSPGLAPLGAGNATRSLRSIPAMVSILANAVSRELDYSRR